MDGQTRSTLSTVLSVCGYLIEAIQNVYSMMEAKEGMDMRRTLREPIE